jgi:hypothetical protein
MQCMAFKRSRVRLPSAPLSSPQTWGSLDSTTHARKKGVAGWVVEADAGAAVYDDRRAQTLVWFYPKATRPYDGFKSIWA